MMVAYNVNTNFTDPITTSIQGVRVTPSVSLSSGSHNVLEFSAHVTILYYDKCYHFGGKKERAMAKDTCLQSPTDVQYKN